MKPAAQFSICEIEFNKVPFTNHYIGRKHPQKSSLFPSEDFLFANLENNH